MSLDWSSTSFPPVVWFERVVNNALNLFVERSLQSDNGNESHPTNPKAA
jgi:hypothetical protein